MWFHNLELSLTTDRFYYDLGEAIRFRVDSVDWQENEPGPPSARPREPEADKESEDEDPYLKAGYRITANVAEQGLGCLAWWGDGDDE